MTVPEGEMWLDLLDLPWEVPDLRWAWTVLDACERRRAERFVHARDRERFIGRRAALRRRLGTLLDRPPQEICYDQEMSGRPFLSSQKHGDTLRFSASSTGPVALFGFRSHQDLGVDVESVRPLPEFTQVARQWLSPAEQLTLAHALPESRTALFFFFWTGLEARLKASGQGLAASRLRPGLQRQPDLGEQRLWQRHWEAEQPSAGTTYQLAMASPDPKPLIRWTVSRTLRVNLFGPTD